MPSMRGSPHLAAASPIALDRPDGLANGTIFDATSRQDMTENEDMRLAEGFEPAGYDAWRDLVEKALKGADFDRALTTETYDGLRLQPLYTKNDAPDALSRPGSGRAGRAAPWDIRQAIVGPSADDAAAQIAEALGEGAHSVLLRFDAGLRSGASPESRPDLVGVDGAALDTSAAIGRALAGVDLATTPVALDAGAGALAAAKVVISLADGGLAAGTSLGLDPISALAGAGVDVVGEWAGAAADLSANAYLMRASSTVFFDAGASEAEELGCLIGSGVALLRALEAAGMAPAEASRRIAFAIALSQDQFLTIAKARAARSLWAAVMKAAGVEGASMRLDGVTAERMFTRHDPHVNVLRATIAGFAGAVGGLDGLTILPFDARLGGGDPLARRVARNLQVVLAEESNLAKVADPGGGSFYLERLTTELAEAGWAVFQEIERAGGMAAAVQGGMLAERIQKTAASRDGKVARRRDAITGVSEFANLAEPTSVGKASGEGQFALRPVAAPFEALRDASDAYAVRTGGRPKIFLANVGALAAYAARAGFSRNAFAAGGVEAAEDGGFDDPSAAAKAFTESGARIVCICGTDGAYAESGAGFAEALKQAGAAQVWLAGRPGDAEAALRAAGVDEFLYAGGDLLQALAAAHHAIGV